MYGETSRLPLGVRQSVAGVNQYFVTHVLADLCGRNMLEIIVIG
jgi:hypothetical protein